MPEFGQDDCWFFVSSLFLLLRGEGWEENLLKMAVFLLMQSVQSFEESLKCIFWENVINNVL